MKLLLQITFIAFIFVFIKLIGKRIGDQRRQEPIIEIDSGKSENSSLKTDSTHASGSDIPDDLTQISGIGPKISTVLMEAGIDSFSKLAQMDEKALTQLMNAAGIRFSDPLSWIQQAKSLT